MSRTLLVEIGTEEIPARFLTPAATSFRELFVEFLTKNSIPYGEVKTFYTPRRMTIIVERIADKQNDILTEVYGPPVSKFFTDKGELTQQAIGYLRAHNITVDEIKTKQKGGKEVVYYVKREPGKPVTRLVSDTLYELVQKVRFPKTMRWNGDRFRFARPIRWMVVMLDDEVIPVEVAGVKSNRISYGLRFDPPITVDHACNYLKLMRAARIEPDPEVRRKKILDAIHKEEEVHNIVWVEDRELLDEVVNLVEAPVPIGGEFPSRYLKLPEPVIITALREHQRYFAFKDRDGRLSTHFLFIGNNPDADIEQVREGLEHIVVSRLEDAMFYFEEDQKCKLRDRIEELKKVVWRAGLGTLYDKTERLMKLTQHLHQYFADVPKDKLERAVWLAKTDMLTTMLRDGKEFTKLQGVIGKEYALLQGEEPEIATAIYEQYLPKTQDDPLPATDIGTILAIADKVDSIVGIGMIEGLPKGSFDPFALRRLAQGVVRIVVGKGLFIKLKPLLELAFKNYGREPEVDKYLAFFKDRLRRMMEDKGVRYDIIEGVVSLDEDDLYDLYLKGMAFNKMRDKPEFEDLVIIARRVGNILEGVEADPKPDTAKLAEPAERAIYSKAMEIMPALEEAKRERRYEDVVNLLLELGPYIHRLFDDVLIMAEDAAIRKNRLALVNFIYAMFRDMADFRKMVLPGD